jgi:lipid-A-disaccharide synthase
MKIYIIAGEASGDLHGANLVRALKAKNPAIELRGWGGDGMTEAGVDVVKHIRELAFMGFAEVIMNLKTILSNISYCKRDIDAFNPDAIILIDYPGFNLRIAPFAKRLGIKVLYYISPQVWAWKSSRVVAIKENVDEMYTILPFEEPWYAKRGLDVNYVGHPLLDELAKQKLELLPENKIALLPGSRKQEIDKMLPIMLSIRKDFPDFKFVVAAAPSIPDSQYAQLAGQDVDIVRGNTYGLLASAQAALVTSGTATLECGLIGTPQVVCYKGNRISYEIAKRVVKLDYISLVNLILNRKSVTELIQYDMNTKRLKEELTLILHEGPKRKKMLADYRELKSVLGGPGASERCANHMLKTMGKP